MENIRTLPMQMISTKEKLAVTAEDTDGVPAWIKKVRQYFGQLAYLDVENSSEIQELYRLADDHLNEDDYKALLNPYNTDNEKHKRMPAKLRNYSIISPLIQRLMGERRKRPNKFSVVAVGPDAVAKIEEQIKEEYRARLVAGAILQLQAKGIPIDAEVEQQVYTDVEKQITLRMTELLAMHGQAALEIMSRSLDLDTKFQDAFYDYLVAGSCWDFKMVNHDDVEYTIVSPKDISVFGWDETSPYAEDAMGSMRRMQWSVASILEHWREDLKEKDIEWLSKLDSDRVGHNDFGNWTHEVSGNRTNSYMNDGTVLVEHLMWKTLTKRGILTYDTPLGEKQMPVDETYVINKAAGDIKVDWTWEPEWWEIYTVSDSFFNSRYGSNSNMLYLQYGPGVVQRTDLNNTAKCRLPTNGIKAGHRYSGVSSVVKTGKSYQELVNILHYRFDMSLARSYDKLMFFPIGLIPNHDGWDPDKWFYNMRAFSVVFFDETKEKATQAMQAMKEIDMSLSQYMIQMWSLVQEVKHEYWDAVGFNPQRYGDVGASAGKGTTERALAQSFTSTNELISRFEKFREKALMGLLDFSKYAWINGKQGEYFQSVEEKELLKINPIEHALSEYGVFAVDPILEQERIEAFKNSVIMPMAQNGGDVGVIAELIEADNYAKIKQLAQRAQEIQREFEMSRQSQAEQAQQQLAETNAAAQSGKDQMDWQIAQLKAKTEIEKALIMADSFNAKEGDVDGDGTAESEEIVNRYYERLGIAQKSMVDNSQAISKQANDRENRDLKKMDIAAKLKIAKENKNKYDSKK
jgi:hypothetical protein